MLSSGIDKIRVLCYKGNKSFDNPKPSTKRYVMKSTLVLFALVTLSASAAKAQDFLDNIDFTDTDWATITSRAGQRATQGG